MAINRALMNRQMYNMGGPSLQTGAPDITLTGDMRPTYSAMRKQRMAGGGIAGLQNRQGYFLGSLVDKIRDDLIPNEIKENPVISGLVGAGLLNQFGLPDFLPNVGVFDDDFGQNFLGNLIGKDLVIGPGGEQISDLSDANEGLGDLVFGMPGAGTDQGVQVGNMGGPGVVSQISKAYEAATNPSEKSFFGDLLKNVGSSITGALTGDSDQAKLAKALAAGAAAGAYVDSQPKDELPTDTTGINFQTAQQVLDDPNQRFKPPVEATQLAAEGGRIGFDMGGGIIGNQEDFNKFLEDMKQRDMSGMQDQILRDYKNYMKRKKMIEQMPEAKDGGRIGAQEGGLMNLGGMEKDYREEGGFVPIGGKEKADDVPARLSKNEFVFTADAVRNAGGGDIDQGAQVMEKLMRNLESGGQVSEESQGLDGAREMFETSQRLEKRII